MTFKKFKPFKEFVTYHQGIGAVGLKILKNGLKAIDKHGKVEVNHVNSNIPPLPCAIPQHISSN